MECCRGDILCLIAVALAMIFVAIRLLRGPAAEDHYGVGYPVCKQHDHGAHAGNSVGSRFYFDIALLIALFGFVGSAAMAKFLLRGEVIEP